MMIESIAALTSEIGIDSSFNLETTSPNKIEDIFLNKLEGTNQAIENAEVVLEKMARGDEINTHEAIITMQKAKMQLSFVVEARNKILEAYQEVMRMQI